VYEHPKSLFRCKYKGHAFFTVPEWVEQIISLPNSVEELRPKKSKGYYIKKCVKEEYIAKISHSESDLQSFYHDIYVPYVQSRFEQHVLLTPYEQMKKYFYNGGLVLVCKDDEQVGGVVFYISNEVLVQMELGIKFKGSNSWQHAGSSLLYWYCILHAYEQGVKEFNMGGTRAWHSDGVFQYKNHWGGVVTRRSRIYNEWTFVINKLSDDLVHRINKIGFLSEISNAMYCVHLSDDCDELREDINSTFSEEVSKLGLAGCVLVSPSSSTIIRPS
jgi:hypothetical protein